MAISETIIYHVLSVVALLQSVLNMLHKNLQ